MNSCGYNAGKVVVSKDSWKNSTGSSVGGLDTSRPVIESTDGGIDDNDVSPKPCNQDIVLGDEQQFPLIGVGQVLLDDLRSAPEEIKESIKAAVVALVDKRVEPYKNHQSPVDPNVTIQSSFIDMNGTFQKSMTTEGLSDPDAPFVYMVLQDLNGILDERDRDECEILITMPAFQEVTDESQIPAYQGNRVIQSSLLMQSNMTSSMTSSMVAGNPLSTVLRKELVKKPSERAAIRNAISQIILDFLKAGHSGPKVNNNLNCSTAMLLGTNVSSYAHDVVDDEVSRLVAFWTSKTVKLDNRVNNRIKKYLFPLKPRNINKSSDSVLQTRQEEDEIPDTPPTAKLLEEKCGDSGYSNNY
eukprot:XP_011662377.1 PREDICTED: uncharacterized protein LOC100893178 [Strongylocentrotus purpuratus]